MVGVFLAVGVRFDQDTRSVASVEAFDQLRLRDDLNLLFIVVDTLRADHLGSYGYERPTSPHLDALSKTGIRFANHLAQSSWTKTSMASLWTSLHPARAGILRSTDTLPSAARLPAEVLSEAGFRTAALWRNGWVAPNFGFAQGFESYVSPRPGPPPAGFRRENPGIRLLGSDFDIVDSFEEFLRTRGQERWFFYAHMMDVHQYATDEHSAIFGNALPDAYDNAIHFTDRAIGSMIGLLDARGLRQRTVIAVVSDHGESFGEHGFEGHARDVHVEVTHTPWLLSLPFRVSPEVVVDSASQNVDVWPTLLDLLGLPGRPGVDGRSFFAEIREAIRAEGGALSAKASVADRARVAHIDRHWAHKELAALPNVALSEGQHRLFLEAGRVELFDVDADPGEAIDISEAHPELTASLRRRVDDYLASKPPWPGGVPQVELDDMQLGQLRALGYVVDPK